MDYEDFFEDFEETELEHYGMPRRSGRYPWGSGENPFQHEEYFGKISDNLRTKGFTKTEIREALGISDEEYRSLTFADFDISRKKLAAKGLSDDEIRKALDMTTTDYRAMSQIAKAAKREADFRIIRDLADKGYSNEEIGKRLDPPIPESTVRSWRDAAFQARNAKTNNTADMLKAEVEAKGVIDIGKGVDAECGVSKERLNTAVTMLELQGYQVFKYDFEQVTNPGMRTTMKVLAAPDQDYIDILKHPDKIQSIQSYMVDGGESIKPIQFPAMLDSNRVMVRYAEEGGKDRDGTIEIRRGVDDLDLGNSAYAQVRIAVDGSHYLKGMAVYSDGSDMPDGVDVIFNTNKHEGTPKTEVFKELKKNKDGTVNQDNPFGALIKAGGQSTYIDVDGNEKLSPINKLREEGDWAEYSKTLASQFLSKQRKELVDRQLDLAYAERADEFSDICNLTNPAVKKKLLSSFAEDCDAAAVDLKAAALPRQATQVILPIPSLKDNEIYAPNYKDGENVVLIRYPHGGIFEIPELTVNNRNPEARNVIGKNGKDAVGINANVAGRLSGADFDGDTVLVIPVNDSVRVKTSNAKEFDELRTFDPKESYPRHAGSKEMKKGMIGREMGMVSNLITDMTIQGASPSEIVRAVKHSMVVIDAWKHKLDYKQSEIDNGIAELKAKYQPVDPTTGRRGVATLLSRAKSPVYVNQRDIFNIDRDTDPETGEKIVRESKPRVNKNGEEVYRKQKTTRMAETDDARELISDYNSAVENSYANYANKLKALANRARKEYLDTEPAPKNSTASETYKEEAASLKSKLEEAFKNAPRERKAQTMASVIVKAQMDANPEEYSEKGDEKKLRQQALTNARLKYGASKKAVQVQITPKEWEAIQAGAISNNMLKDILDNTDMDKVREYAMPRYTEIPAAKRARIKAMAASGNSNADIAEALGISTSTVLKYLG